MAPREQEKDAAAEVTPSEEFTTYRASKSSNPQWKATEHILWINVFWFTALHAGAAYGAYLVCTTAQWKTSIFALVTYYLSLFGIAGGVHRLWAHRAYKAKWPLRVLMATLSTIAYQNSIYEWCRDHRVHHKFTETDADPVNSDRGFFFSHCGWLMSRKHPDVRRIGLQIDLTDLLADPVVAFQKRYYAPLVVVLCFVLPTVVPVYLWGEDVVTAFFVCVLLRYAVGLNSTWFVNSAAHMWGFRPYDRSIAPAENYIVSMLAAGEGFHNYHHAFPWDYSTSEWKWALNFSTMAIDFFACIGWAYDIRKATPEMIEARKKRTGKTTEHEY